MFRSIPTLAIVAVVALAGPVHSEATQFGQTSISPKCSRNSDDITSAVVIQNANGEFCEGSSTGSGDTGAAIDGKAKVATKLSAGEFQTIRTKIIKDQMFYCADQGVPANFCRTAVDDYVDRALLLYYRKCERQKIDLARCDAELVEAVQFQWY